MFQFYENITRRKTEVKNEESEANTLNRVLRLHDLMSIAIGTTLGCGVYIIVGDIAVTNAGPGVVLSFLLAALTAGVSGLCYAEFAALVPKAGSAYIYCYVTIGEFVAFVLGWNMLCEYMIGN